MLSQFDITTAKWGDVKKNAEYHWAILPWGATEPHNGHLPYCTDILTSSAIGCEVAEKLAAFGINAMVLPGIPLGSQNPGQTSLPFCIHTRQETQAAVLRDIVESLRREGIGRLFIINGHGGNSFKGMIRDLLVDYPDFLILQSDWYTVVPRKGYFDADIDEHAGEQETSVIMHYYPELVKMEYAGDGTAKPFAIDALNRKVAWHPRNWTRITPDTGIGNPSQATPEKGRRYTVAVVEQYVALLKEITEKGDLYL
ncbi:MAG: creatininase family protein [Bacteroidales bacterium]|nr:creatininase family protein [Bacteroidales bacterium]